MLIEILLAVVLWYAYWGMFRVWRRLVCLRNACESLGYKVFKPRYGPIGSHAFIEMFKNTVSKGDALWDFKNTFVGYDMVIQNTFYSIDVWFFNPDLLKDFSSRQKQRFLVKQEEYRKQLINELIGLGTFTAHGDQWKKRRKIVAELLNFNFIKKYVPDIIRTVEKAYDRVQKSPEFPKVEMFDYLTEIFGTITGKLFLGFDINDYQIDGKKMTNYMVDLMTLAYDSLINIEMLLFGSSIIKLRYRKVFRDLLKAHEKYIKKLEELVRKKLDSLERNQQSGNQFTDLVTLMYRHNQKCKDPAERYSVDDMVGELGNLLFAGTDTSACFNLMTIYNLAQYPAIKAKALKEVEFHLGKQITYEGLKDMKYMENLHKEISRTFGPVNLMFPRFAKENFLLAKIPIPKNTFLQACVMPNHYNPLYYDNPHQFDPDRWDNSKVEEINPYAFMGFAAGPRSCVGKYFALLSSRIVISVWLKRYDWKLTEEIRYEMKYLYSPVLQKLEITKRDQKVDS